MARVEMLVDISGGRGDGTEWPRHGGVVDCDEREADALVRGGHARRVTEPDLPPEIEAVIEESRQHPELDQPRPERATPAAEAPEPLPAADESPEPENGPQDDDTPADDDSPADPAKPRVRDAKEIWEQHAMTVHGVDVNTARSMTKKELIDAYGN